MFAEIAVASSSDAMVAKLGTASEGVSGRTAASQPTMRTVRQTAMIGRMRRHSPERQGATQAKGRPDLLKPVHHTEGAQGFFPEHPEHPHPGHNQPNVPAVSNPYTSP